MRKTSYFRSSLNSPPKWLNLHQNLFNNPIKVRKDPESISILLLCLLIYVILMSPPTIKEAVTEVIGLDGMSMQGLS